MEPSKSNLKPVNLLISAIKLLGHIISNNWQLSQAICCGFAKSSNAAATQQSNKNVAEAWDLYINTVLQSLL